MSEQQREMTEEELKDGIPVDPTEEEREAETLPAVPSEEDVVVVPATIEGDLPVDEEPVLIVRPHMRLEPQYLVRYGYLEEVPFGGKKQYVLSADGIRHVAQMMGISIINCSIEERDGFFYAEAVAHDPHTGARALGKVRQSLVYGKQGRPDPHAYEKANTRAQRNALRSLIPYKRIVTACVEYLRQANAK